MTSVVILQRITNTADVTIVRCVDGKEQLLRRAVEAKMRSHVATHNRSWVQVRTPRIGTIPLSQHRPARDRSAAHIQRTTTSALDSSEAQAFTLPNGLVLR